MKYQASLLASANLTKLKTMKDEEYYEKEFDRLYEEGKIGLGVLDDDLPDYRETWIVDQMNEDREGAREMSDLISDSRGQY